MPDALKVAIAGLGTVGGGTVRLLQANGELLARRLGRAITITAVADRDRRERGFSVDGYRWFDDPLAMAREAGADVIVELIGGHEGIARALCQTAIAEGIHVVTANKALIAHHGIELAAAAEAKGSLLPARRRSPAASPSLKACARGWWPIGPAASTAFSTGPVTIF